MSEGPSRAVQRGAGLSTATSRETRIAVRRAEIVRATVRAVRRIGAAVSVSQIADVAGVTKPVLYRFFADRADLQGAVSELAVTALLERVTDELRRDRDPAEKVRVVIEAFLRGVDEDAELWRFVLRASVRAGVGTSVVEDARAQITRVLAAALTERLADEGLDAGGAEAWAHGLFGMVYAAAEWWLNHRTMSRDALSEELSTLVWGGLSGVMGSVGLGARIPGALPPVESGVKGDGAGGCG